MSGSHFLCNIGAPHYVLLDFIYEIEKEVMSGKHEQITVNHFCDALRILKIAKVYLERIDYYLDYDDGEDLFNFRLPKQLHQMEKKENLKKALKELRDGWQG